jgi:hypothetical protein
MRYYHLQQKQERVRENLIFQLSKFLRWFLQTLATLLATFIKSMLEALKMLFHS